MLVIAVGQPGSVLNAVGTGVAKLVTEKTGTEMRVRVTSGMDAIVGSGDAELGVSASDSAHLSSNGLRHYEARPQKALRLALAGPPLILGFVVRADAPYRTLEDLKGLAVPGEYPNARPMHFDGKAMLSTVGMTWDDLQVVPVASFRDGIQAFIEGRTEAANGSVGSGLIQQADANLGGVRFLTLPDREGVSEHMWNEEPGLHTVRVPSGFALGIDEDLILAAKETYITANADVSADVVYDIVALLWEQMGELASVHPLFERWTHADMVNARVTIPFHDGTIRFLKEVGEWTPEHERVHQELLTRLSS
jgi:TRAP transporter TAXI family solute receptor